MSLRAAGDGALQEVVLDDDDDGDDDWELVGAAAAIWGVLGVNHPLCGGRRCTPVGLWATMAFGASWCRGGWGARRRGGEAHLKAMS